MIFSHKAAGLAHHVLAIVEDDQHVPPCQMPRKDIERIGFIADLDPQRRRSGTEYQFGILQACQLHQPYAVREPGSAFPGYVKGKFRFADTAGPVESHEPFACEQFGDALELFAAANETRTVERPFGEISGRHYRRTWMHRFARALDMGRQSDTLRPAC